MTRRPCWLVLLIAVSLALGCTSGRVGVNGGGTLGPDSGSPHPTPGDAGPPTNPDAGANDAGTPPDAGPVTMGCGSGGGGPLGGPADLFPCDSPWYKDVSAAPVASESATLIPALAARGFGPDFGADKHTLQVTFDFTLLHASAATPSYPVTVNLYPSESDLLAQPDQGFHMPTPLGGVTEGQTGYQCDAANNDCHTLVVDDARHILYELGNSTFDSTSNTWNAGQESVWNLQWRYGPAERGLACTSTDAAGLSVSAGLIGLRETRAAAQTSGGYLHHALRLVLPNTRVAAAWVAPASHLTKRSDHPADGIPYGTRFRLKATFDENRVASPGGKAIVRTLKRYGMIFVDGGQIAFTAEKEDWYRAQDPALVWAGTLGPQDFDALSVNDFEIVDWDASTYHTATQPSNCVVDPAPLQGVLP